MCVYITEVIQVKTHVIDYFVYTVLSAEVHFKKAPNDKILILKEKKVKYKIAFSIG